MLTPEERAIRLLIWHWHMGNCAYHWDNQRWEPGGQTCSEYRSRREGQPCGGCHHCETEILLKELGRLPKKP